MESRSLDFEAWYRANGARLVATVGAAVGSEDLARDAVAEACARALVRWRRVGSPTNPSGWVYVVALREARRRKSRRDLHVELGPESPAPSIEPPVNDPLWLAMQALPERMRVAVALRYIGDLAEADVARVMSISRGGASSLLHKARTTLRLRLEEGASDDIRG